ncbi:uncharacterized protein LOC135706365 [Ochlerotatus camptorhynchus]|uniref:uncharacterized protein LOC135706365 n=1 Tax=Ochlerotatus camptorhynchus TaxID=644619 RepID=UPI0031D3A7B4
MPNQTVHHHQLDREYKNSLGLLKEQIPSVRDPNEIAICAKWIQRFNQVHSSEKPYRNKLMELLIGQLAKDNLNYPFIFLNNLDKPLSLVDQEVRQLFFSSGEEGGDLEDILLNMKQLLVDAETMNIRVEEDLESIRSETLAIKQVESRSLDYSLLLCDELRRLLTDEIPKVVAVPNRQIVYVDGLKQADLNWILLSVEAIRQTVIAKLPVIPENASKAVQTHRDWKLDNLEAYYERKFARLYTDSLLKERAQQIKLKSEKGGSQIDQSRKFERRFRRKIGQQTT